MIKIKKNMMATRKNIAKFCVDFDVSIYGIYVDDILNKNDGLTVTIVVVHMIPVICHHIQCHLIHVSSNSLVCRCL